VLSPPPRADAGPLVATLKDPIAERFIVLSEDADGCVHVTESGRAVPFSWRSIPSPFPNAKLPRALGATPAIAIVVDHKSVRPWISVMSADRFQRLSERLWIVLGMFTGMIATLFVVGILILRYHPSAVAWAYLAYLATLQLYQLQGFGVGPAWLPFWPPPEMHHLLQAIAAGIAVIGMALPVITFLRPRGRLNTILIIGVALSASGFFLSASNAAGYRFGAAILPILAVVVIVLLVRRLSTGEPAVRWFAVGLAAALAGGGTQAAAVALQGAGLPPITAFAFPIGNVIESSCWLIAILSRLRADNQRLHRRLLYEARHDSLTGLYSRIYIKQRIVEAIAAAKSGTGRASGLLYIDVGALKQINERFGQAVGDEALSTFAAILRRLGLNALAIGRYGGDEFVVLMKRDAHWSHTEGAAATIVGRFRDPLPLTGQGVLLRPDIAIVRIEPSYKNADEVIQDANRALQVAKQLGGHRAVLFEPVMRAQSQQQNALRATLERALRDDRLELHYQPLVQLDRMTPVGFEALLRLRHSNAEKAGLEQVLAVAETAGMLPALGERIVEMALQQIAAWQREGVWLPSFFLSINVREQQLVDSRLLGALHTGLQRHGIDAAAIRLEVSERSLGSDIDWSRHVLPRLLNQHVLLGVDNFGAGVASLTTLTDLQPDYIKLDRSLVAALANLPRAQNLGRAVKLLATELGSMAIAEGIETREQLNILSELGYEHGQGQAIAPPMSGKDTAAWIQLSECHQDALAIDGASERQLH
jgi:diguanylate cyclase (GGDEF)-like protein